MRRIGRSFTMSSRISVASTRRPRAKTPGVGSSSFRRKTSGSDAFMSPAGPGSELLVDVLADARDAGFLGPGPIEPHIAHAEGFGAAAEQALGRAPENFADLGTGGGIPGL